MRTTSTSTPRRLRHHHRLSLLRPLPLLLSLVVTTASAAMLRPTSHYRQHAAAFLLPHLRRTRGLASSLAAASPAEAVAPPPPQPQAQAPPQPQQPKGPPLALDTDAGRALLRLGWGVESAACVRVVAPAEWRAAAERHRADMMELLGGSLRHDSDHPVYNFLFEYYHFKPQNLLDYSPGVESPTAFVLPSTSTSSSGDEIEAAAALDALRLLAGKAVLVSGLPESEAAAPAPPATGKGKGVGWMWVPPPLGTKGWTEKHVTSLRLAHEVLRASVDRPPIFYCYGAHEWAMLYHPTASTNPPPHKYQRLPLRISQQVLNDFVEARPIRCTHYDAFRFFAPEARALNVYGADLAKRRPGQIIHEQPGCLHAGMDLFKWALKLGPYAPSDLVTEALRLAVQCRVLDMRASPYDLRGLDPSIDFGFPIDPVCIETEDGRREYQRLQQQLYEWGLPIRRRLLRIYDAFFALVEREAGG